MTTTQDSEWLDTEIVELYAGKKFLERGGSATKAVELNPTLANAKAKIRSHILSEVIELIGDDEYKSCILFDEFGYHGKECDSCFEKMSRDELRAELRQSFITKYSREGKDNG